MTLKTRKPTGAVPWPLILVEGGEKTGKSYSCAVLSASKKVGRTLWLDWGEGAADEYGAITGARYEVIEHDGSWADIIGQVAAAKDEAQRARDAGEPPVVLILDSVTCEWEQLKDWASDRARTQGANREKLRKDPNAEVAITMNLWNDAASRHRKLMTILMTFPGIVVITARGGETALVEGGKPVEGKKSYRVDGHKSLAYDASCWLRLARDSRPLIVGARSVHAGARPGVDPAEMLPKDWTLEWLIFDKLKCDPATAHARDLAEPKTGVRTPEQIRDEALETTTTPERIRALYTEAKGARYDSISLENETGDEEPLLGLLIRVGKERDGKGTKQAATRPAATQPPVQPVPPVPAATAEPVPAALDPGDPWAPKVEELSSDDEARAALDEAAALLTSGAIDAERFGVIEAAVLARFPGAQNAPAVAA